MHSHSTQTNRQVRSLAIFSFLVFATSCAQCAPDRVGTGVARLTVRNVGAITTLVNGNDSCGFNSAAVKSAPTVSGSVGSAGSLTFTVTDCAIDLGGGAEISRDCNDVVTTGTGKVTVSATRKVDGILTGNPASPIVPSSADAVTITITRATFDNFEVKSSASKSSLKMKSGSLSAVVMPRLAVSATSGACAISTPNVNFSSIVYSADSKLKVSGDNTFDVDVKGSNISAQNGTRTATNDLSGTVKVWDTEVPAVSDGLGLDPEFKADKFASSYACTADLATPVSFTCGDLTPLLADGAARLSVQAFGTVVSLVNANTTCGFSSPTVGGAATSTGEVGGTGSVVFTTTDCKIEFAQMTELSPDCSGTKTLVTGTVTVSGTKTLTGRLTGNPLNPIAPISDKPAAFDLTMTFDKFKVGSSAGPNALLIKSGTLAGNLSPRTALSSTTGACSANTPAIEVTELTYTAGKVALTSSSGTFDLDLSTSALAATNGVWVATNALSGTITVIGKSLTVPSDKKGLNPAFDATVFNTSWPCAPGLVTPVSYACEFKAPLAQGASRLTPRIFGAIVSLTDANPACGFSSPAVAGTPAFTGTQFKDDSEATFTIATGCTITLPADTLVSTDCAGVTTRVGGTVVVTGTKKVRGYQTGNTFQPVVPTSRDAVDFALTATLTNFVVKTSDSASSLTVKSGTLAGKLSPRLGIDTRTGACSISTPVATFSNLTYTDAALRLVSDGSTFDLTAATSNLAAQNGTKDDVSNTLTGSITLDGTAVTIPVNPSDNKLNPSFVQATFDAAYVCTPNLVVAPSAGACSFRQALGAGAARLLIKDVATATSMLDKNTTCGFAAASVLGAPTNVMGAPGEQGSITWAANACAVGSVPAGTTIAADCLGNQTKVGGSFTATATKQVSGLRGNSPPIVPLTRTAAVLNVTVLALAGFSAYDALPDGGVASKSTVTGSAALSLAPIAGESSTNAGVFSVGTPVAGVTGVTLPTGTMRIYNGGSQFDVTLTAVALQAQAGSYMGASNTISGSLVVDGEMVVVPASPLVSGFSQAVFDSTYVCTPGLKEVVPAN